MDDGYAIYIRSEGRLLSIACKDVVLVEAYENHVRVIMSFSSHPYPVHISMNQIMIILPPGFFYRVHRSYIVGLYHVKRIEKDHVVVGAWKIPLSRQQAKGLKEKFIVLGVFWGRYK